MLMDGCAAYGSKRKNILHSVDTGIHGVELKRNGNEAMILGKEDHEELSKYKAASSEVAVQAMLSYSHDGEFTFSCIWDSPGNALLQCNIIDGWVVGVPEIPLESSGPLTGSPYPVEYEPPTKIRLRSEGSAVRVKPKHQEAKDRSFLTPSLLNVGLLPDESVDTVPANQRSMGVKTKSIQVHLPINQNCESLRLSVSTNRSLLKGCLGFHGYASVASGIDWKLESLCGIRKDVFDRYLFKVCQITPWGMANKTALLIFLMKLKLGLSFSNLAIFFGLDRVTLSQTFNDTLDKVQRHSEKEIVWSSGLIQTELPTYFQGLYKESRVILICSEMEVEQPQDEQLGYSLFSSASRMYSYKFVIGMTPGGRVCFRSKPYEGRKSFKRVLKDCGFLSNLNSKELVLTRSITPEMEFMVKKGVLLVAPQPSNDCSAYDVEGDIGRHIERCEKRLKFFKVLNKIPISLSSKIDQLCHVCCCLINELPPILRYDQPEDEEL